MPLPTSAWLRALERFNARDFAEAASLASAGLAQQPDEGLLWQLRGTALWMQREYADACTDLETATCLTPLMPLARCALADCYLRQGRREPAVTIYEYLVEWRGTPIAFLPSVARALGSLEEYELALEACGRILDAEPDNHAAHFGMAFYLHRSGAPLVEVKRSLRTAYELRPHAMTYRLNLALVLAALDENSEAASILQGMEAATLRCHCQLRILASLQSHLGQEALAQASLQRLEELTARKPAL